MTDYDERRARAIAMPPRPRPLTDRERAARKFDWHEFDATLVDSDGHVTRAFIFEALPASTHPDDAPYRLSLRLRKGERVHSLKEFA